MPLYDPQAVQRTLSRQAQTAADEKAEKPRMLERDRGRATQPPGFDKQWRDYTDTNRGAGPRRGFESGVGFRDYQKDLLNSLQRDAAGNGPGQALVRMQAQQAADRGSAQQLAMGASARPGQAGMAGTNAAFNSANMQSAVGGQAAQAGLQARLAATGQLGQFSGQARRGDLDQMGLNDQTQLEALRQRLQLSGMGQQGEQWWQGMQNQNRQFEAAQPSGWERGIGAGVGIAEALAAFVPGGGARTGGGGGRATYGNGVMPFPE